MFVLCISLFFLIFICICWFFVRCLIVILCVSWKCGINFFVSFLIVIFNWDGFFFGENLINGVLRRRFWIFFIKDLYFGLVVKVRICFLFMLCFIMKIGFWFLGVLRRWGCERKVVMFERICVVGFVRFFLVGFLIDWFYFCWLKLYIVIFLEVRWEKKVG